MKGDKERYFRYTASILSIHQDLIHLSPGSKPVIVPDPPLTHRLCKHQIYP